MNEEAIREIVEQMEKAKDKAYKEDNFAVYLALSEYIDKFRNAGVR